MSQIATLKIWRGESRKSGRVETHAVPFERGQSVLDGLRWIRVHKDPSLAIRFSMMRARERSRSMRSGTAPSPCRTFPASLRGGRLAAVGQSRRERARGEGRPHGSTRPPTKPRSRRQSVQSGARAPAASRLVAANRLTYSPGGPIDRFDAVATPDSGVYNAS